MTGSGTSVGVGMTTSGQVGVGGAQTKSMTELAPGRDPLVASGCWPIALVSVPFGLFLLAIAGDDLASKICGVVLLLLPFAYPIGARLDVLNLRPAWLEKVRMYEHGWICLQCGNSWISADGQGQVSAPRK
jgi:hypothetical protein